MFKHPCKIQHTDQNLFHNWVHLQIWFLYIYFQNEKGLSIHCLTLSNPIFLPTAYSPALHPCHFPTSTTAQIQCTITWSHQNTWPAKKQKEYNLRYLLAKVRTTWGKTSDRLRQRSGCNKNMSDVFRHRSRTGKS
jgi:hypothetical protein